MNHNRVPAFEVLPNPRPATPEDRAAILKDPGFGTNFTDHMITIDWTQKLGWHTHRVQPFGPLSILPGASALQYAQQVFEGLKVYRHADSSVWAFRPEENFRRLQRSAARFHLPAPDEDTLLGTLRLLVDVDHSWIPGPEGEKSLYMRPFLIGTEQYLGVRPATEVTYGLIASPAGAYVREGLEAMDVWLGDRWVRAAAGGTGDVKWGGNYAAGLMPFRQASENGCAQTLFLDAETRSWIEELAGMNIMFVTAEGRLITPELSGSILPGITRDSLLHIAAQEMDLVVEERKFGLTEWRERASDGSLTEVFACGTAAVVTAIAQVKGERVHIPAAKDTAGPVTRELRQRLVDLQYGRRQDNYGWMLQLRS